MGRNPRGLSLLAGLTLMSAGCSLAFVDGPPAGPAPPEATSCTRSWIVPVLDIAAAGIGVRGAIVARGDVVANRREKQTFNAIWATAFVVSAAVGLDRVRRCRQATTAPPG